MAISCTTLCRLRRNCRANSVPGTVPFRPRIHSRMRRRRVVPATRAPAPPLPECVSCLVTYLVPELVTAYYSTAPAVRAGYTFGAWPSLLRDRRSPWLIIELLCD